MEYTKHFERVLTLEKKGAVATINFCCAENTNKIHQQFADEMYGALSDIQYDNDIRVVVLRAEGEVFLGQGDLQNLIAPVMMQNTRAGRQCMNKIGDCIRMMYLGSKPIIAAVDGAAIGGGCGFTLSSDIIIASEKASFNETIFAKSCLPPDCGGLWSLQRLVGPMQAKYLALRPDPVGAEDALALGLVAKVVPSEKLYDEVYALAEHIAGLSPVGVHAIKQISNRLPEYSLETYMQQEHEYIANGIMSDDFAELVASITEQRAPQFQGH